jgi:hypothetical protein
MSKEFASPAECLPGLADNPESRRLDLEQVSMITRNLRDLALFPQHQLGDPLYAELLDEGKAYVIRMDGTSIPVAKTGDSRLYDIASDITYGITPEMSGYLRFSSGSASAAKEVYIPDSDRAYDPENLSVDDIVEAKTGLRIQVAVSWDNYFIPNNRERPIGVHKRFYFLGGSEDGPSENVLCLTVFSLGTELQHFVFEDTFEDIDVSEDIKNRFSDYLTTVSMEDIERINTRIQRNVAEYKKLADSVRSRKFGNVLLRFASLFTHRHAGYAVKDIAPLLHRMLTIAQQEHSEDDPADGMDGNFDVLID